jgi:pimeloyl-ACP methyl ester carboxylesterase
MFNCLGRLHKIHAPTLILHGRRDKTVPYALAEETHAGIAHAALIPFNDGHLFFLLRERERFRAAVDAFLGE